MRLQDHIWETVKIVTCMPVDSKVVSYSDSKLIRVVEEETFNGDRESFITCEKGRFVAFPEDEQSNNLMEWLWKLRLSYFTLYGYVIVYLPSRKGIDKVLDKMNIDHNVVAKAKSLHL